MHVTTNQKKPHYTTNAVRDILWAVKILSMTNMNAIYFLPFQQKYNQDSTHQLVLNKIYFPSIFLVICTIMSQPTKKSL
jgi:hypothetical protein